MMGGCCFGFGEMLEVLLVLGAVRCGRRLVMMMGGWWGMRMGSGRGWRGWDAVGELGRRRVELLHFDVGLVGVRQMVLVVLVWMVVLLMGIVVGVMVEGWGGVVGGGGLIGVAATLAAHCGRLVGVGVAEGREAECAGVGGGRAAIVVGRRTSFVVLEHRCEERFPNGLERCFRCV